MVVDRGKRKPPYAKALDPMAEKMQELKRGVLQTIRDFSGGRWNRFD
jgi:hypothetical protein